MRCFSAWLSAARDLDVHEYGVRKWVLDQGDPKQSFPGKGQMTPEQPQINRLHREVAKLKAKRDILDCSRKSNRSNQSIARRNAAAQTNRPSSSIKMCLKRSGCASRTYPSCHGTADRRCKQQNRPGLAHDACMTWGSATEPKQPEDLSRCTQSGHTAPGN